MSSCFRETTRRVFCSLARRFQTMHLSLRFVSGMGGGLQKGYFTPDAFYTRHFLHQTTLTPNAFYKRILHQRRFTLKTFPTRHVLHETRFTPDQTRFTSNTFYTRHLFRQRHFSPETFNTKHPSVCGFTSAFTLANSRDLHLAKLSRVCISNSPTSRGIAPVIRHHQAHILQMWMCNNQDNGSKTCYACWKNDHCHGVGGLNIALMESVVGLYWKASMLR